MINKKNIIIASFLMCATAFSMEIETEIYTGVGLNLGVDNMAKSMEIIPRIINMTAPKRYAYIEEPGTIYPADTFNRGNYNGLGTTQLRLPFINPIDQRAARELVHYGAKAFNIEKTLLDARINIKDWGLKLRTKIKSKSNRVDERFNYLDVDSMFFTLNSDNPIGEINLRYDYYAKDDKVSGIERYLDEDYTEKTSNKDKTLNINGNLNVLKKQKTYVKPKIYFDYNQINGELKSYYFSPTVVGEPIDGLSIEVGISYENDLDKTLDNELNRNNILNKASQASTGYDNIEYYKKYTQGNKRDIENAVITSKTGANRLDGLYSGSLYGEDGVEFILHQVKDFFIENKYAEAKTFFDKVEKGELSLFWNLFTITTFGLSLKNNLENDIPKLTEKILNNVFDKLNLSYDAKWRKYDALSFIPKILHPVLPGYESVYKNDNTKAYIDFEKMGEAIKNFMLDRDKRTPILPKDFEYISNFEKTRLLGKTVIDGTEYDIVSRFTRIQDDAVIYMIDPLKKAIKYDKITGSGWDKFTLIFEAGDFVSLMNKLFANNYNVPEIDLLRPIYFFDTEYNYNQKKLLNLLKNNSIAKEAKENQLLLNDVSNNEINDMDKAKQLYYLDKTVYQKGKFGINSKISYKNEEYNLKFDIRGNINTPTKISNIYYTSGKGGNKTLLNNKVYEIKFDNINLVRIESDSDELAQGQKYAEKSNGSWGYYDYKTKHKRYTIIEEYTKNHSNINMNFKYNDYGFDLNIGSNVDFDKYNYKNIKTGIVYSYDEGRLSSLFGKFAEDVNMESPKLNKIPIFKKELRKLDLEYNIYNIYNYIKFRYNHNPSNEWNLAYGLNLDSNIEYINKPKYLLNGDEIKINVLIRDENNNPIDKNGNPVIINNETVASLRKKYNIKPNENIFDKFQKEEIVAQSKSATVINGIEPFVEVNYKPFNNIVFKNKVKIPLLFNKDKFDGFMFALESGIALVW